MALDLSGVGWKLDTEVAALALLVIADASSFWSANNPSFFTVRTFTTKDETKAAQTKTDIRIGGGKAVLETVAVGTGAALISKSWWPLAVALVYITADWIFYEWALANPHDSDVGIADQDDEDDD